MLVTIKIPERLVCNVVGVFEKVHWPKFAITWWPECYWLSDYLKACRQNILIYNYTIYVPLSSGGNVAFICLTEWVDVVAVCGVALVDNGGWDAPEIVSNVLTLIKIITTNRVTVIS